MAGDPTASNEEMQAVEQLRAENAALRARVAELEAARPAAPAEAALAPESHVEAVEDLEGTIRCLRESQRLLLALVDNSPSLMFVKDVEGRIVLANRKTAQLFDRSVEELLGATDTELFSAQVAAELRAQDLQVMSSQRPIEFEEEQPTPGGVRNFLKIKFPAHDSDNKLVGVGCIVTDITERKRIDAERHALQERMIAAQHDALRELSAPLIPVAPGVLAMPLVGTIDSMRAGEILETLLEGIHRQSAQTAILDVTGVRVVDTQVASALVGSARAARLLGARVVLTGISPSVAQTLVALDADLSGIVTLGTLQAGITYALRRT